MRTACAGLALLGTIGVAACAPRYVVSPAPAVLNASLPEATVTRHVLVVSVDGLRPDVIDARLTPTLHRLMQSGSYSLKATTIMPSNTLPSHTSMLTGEPPERHLVKWNNVPAAKFDTVEVPTVFGVARARGYRTAAFFSKSKFHTLQRAGTLDYSQAPGGWFGKWSSDRTVADVEKYLATTKPNLLFVHLSDPDTAGHEDGWMSAEYRRAVTIADAALGRLLTAADAAFGATSYAVIVSADHGGHDKGHGSDDALDVTIPWIVWGRGVRQAELTGVPIRTMDTASTVLWMLGVPEPTDWIGRPVTEAFNPGPAAPASVPAASLQIQ
jgi:predicted AlkP superfamily pyrophosphatase or phosphodiesterase